MTEVRIAGYSAGDDLTGEPSSWLIFNTETKERRVEINPNYVSPPPPTELELVEQEIADLESRLADARAYRDSFGTQSGTSVAPDSDDPQNTGSKPDFNWQEDYY